jgi:hypothetical protein
MLSLAASYPQWWLTRGVVTTGQNTVTNDFAPATQGQLKWIATQARDELNDNLPDGSGFDVDMMVNAFGSADNYAAVNIGQVKTVAVPFYDRLIGIGFATNYPWAGSTNVVNDFAPANIGQVKNLFSFDLALDSDGDGMPDWWERTHGLDPFANDASLDPDGDGLDNLHEYMAGGNPHAWSSAGDSFSDGWKNAGGLGLNTSYAAGTLAACGLSYAELQALGANADARLVDLTPENISSSSKWVTVSRERCGYRGFQSYTNIYLKWELTTSDTSTDENGNLVDEAGTTRSFTFETALDTVEASGTYHVKESWPYNGPIILHDVGAWERCGDVTGHFFGSEEDVPYDYPCELLHPDDPGPDHNALIGPAPEWITADDTHSIDSAPPEDELSTHSGTVTLSSLYDIDTLKAKTDDDITELKPSLDTLSWAHANYKNVESQRDCTMDHVTHSDNVSVDGSAPASRHLLYYDSFMTATCLRYTLFVPYSVKGVVYRAIITHTFHPDDSSKSNELLKTSTFIGVGNGGNLTLKDLATQSTDITVDPPTDCGEIAVGVTTLTIDNPTDLDHNGIVDDFANEDWWDDDRPGNCFDFQIDGTGQYVCKIPVRLYLSSMADEQIQKLEGNITVELPDLPQMEGAPVLTWDTPDSDGNTGVLVYMGHGVWQATATYTGLPDVPSKSYGRVPKDLHDLLAGQKVATVTIGNCDWLPEDQCTRKVPYEMYYGENLKISGRAMADTTYNYEHYINRYLVKPVGAIGKEMYEKMNCSYESFTFPSLDRAKENFILRREYVRLMCGFGNSAVFDANWRDTNNPALYPRCGDTRYKNHEAEWEIGDYWNTIPPDLQHGFVEKFIQKAGHTPSEAIRHAQPYRGECLGGSDLALFTSVANMIGSQRFNTLHRGSAADDLLTLHGYNRFHVLLHTPSATDTATMVPGDRVYMVNSDLVNYDQKSPWIGENGVYCGWTSEYVPLFTGIGLGKFQREKDWRDSLKKAYFAFRGFYPADDEVKWTNIWRIVTGD